MATNAKSEPTAPPEDLTHSIATENRSTLQVTFCIAYLLFVTNANIKKSNIKTKLRQFLNQNTYII